MRLPCFPDETFELWSVPSFSSGKPEIVKGLSIGSTKQKVQANDILVCKINPRINRVWQVSDNLDFRKIASSEWIVIRSSKIISSYLRHFFSSPSFRERICDEVTGVGGSLTRAQPKRVATFSVPLAPLNEQKRIADKLDRLLAKVDACRERCDRIPLILKRFRQSVLAAATSGELTEDWRESNDHSHSPRTSWQSLLIGDLVIGKPRNGYSPRAVEFETKTKSLTLTATTSGRFNPKHFKYINETIPQDSHLWLEPEDILIQRANTLEYVGVSAIYDGLSKGFMYPDLMMKCRANSKVITKFLYYLLSSDDVRFYFRDNATGTAGNMPKINQQTVISAPVLVPPIEEQQEIVRRVEKLFAFADRLESRYQTARTHIDRLTPAILDKAFRGELVSQDPNDEPASELLARIQGEPQNISPNKRDKRPSESGKASQTQLRFEVPMIVSTNEVHPETKTARLKEMT